MSKWTMTLLIAWFVIISSSVNVLGSIEGYFFPVTEKFKIESSYTENGDFIFRGSFEKIRDCGFGRAYGVLHEDGASTEIKITFLDQNRARKEGSHTYGPWSMKINEDQLKNVEFFALHSCNPLYQTKTRMK